MLTMADQNLMTFGTQQCAPDMLIKRLLDLTWLDLELDDSHVTKYENF